MKKFLLFIFFISCSKNTPLIPLEKGFFKNISTTDLTASFCAPSRYPKKIMTKYLFVIDHSSSNTTILPCTDDEIKNNACAASSNISSTDASGDKRYNTIQQFIFFLLQKINTTNFQNVYISSFMFNTKNFVNSNFTQSGSIQTNSINKPCPSTVYNQSFYCCNTNQSACCLSTQQTTLQNLTLSNWPLCLTVPFNTPQTTTNDTGIIFLNLADPIQRLQLLTGLSQSHYGTNAIIDITQPITANPLPLDFEGNADYLFALQNIQNTIQSDAQYNYNNFITSNTKSLYHIIFLTDGSHIYGCQNNTSSCAANSSSLLSTCCTKNTNGSSSSNDTYQSLCSINIAIKNIIGLKNDPQYINSIEDITFNTAFYTNSTLSSNNPAIMSACSSSSAFISVQGCNSGTLSTTDQIIQSCSFLKQIALTNNGRYFFLPQDTFHLPETSINLNQNILPQLNAFFIDNTNALWWNDGRFLHDSDGDGLPDEIEIQMGSNPQKKDSDDNGVSDFVEYRLAGKPCLNNNCSSSERNTYQNCDRFLSTTVQSPNAIITYSDTDNDGLNNCEELLLGSSYQNFSTNKNFIPDFLAFKAWMSITPGIDDSQKMAFNDGILNVQRLMLGLPLVGPTPQNVTPRTIDLMIDSALSTAENTCYHLTVQNIQITDPNEGIQMYLIFSPIDGESNSTLIKSSVKPAGSTVTFTDNDFPTK